jgi:hypothetical protein
MQGSSPARLYCLLVGGVLVAAGIIGFFYASGFDAGDKVCINDNCDKVLGILAVNGWHNLVHLGIGAVLLLAAGGAARIAALGVGGLYIALAILGWIATGDGGITFVAENGVLIDLVPVNDEDNVLHLILGLTGIAAGFASGTRPATAAAA